MTVENRDGSGHFVTGCILITLIVGSFACVCTWLKGYDAGIIDARREAVKIGVAEWVCDEVGRPSFQWKVSE
jgi:hypothetical protein